MKKLLTTKALASAFLLLAPLIASAQVTVNNAEGFAVGNVLRFVQCHTAGVQPGSAGASATWDFSSLVPNGDTMTEQMVDPTATSYASQFPLANFVEKYSDGTFVFVNKTPPQDFLVGYVDSVSGLLIKYPNSALFAQRPISYNDQLNDPFTALITGPSFSSHGAGQQTVSADGYGTLILPNGTFNNALRLHIGMVEVDTAIGIGTYTTTHSESYVWFDNAHTSALLKIDSSNTSGVYITKSVGYLLNEFTANHQPVFNLFNIGASFVDNALVVFGLQRGDETVEVRDAVGRICVEQQVRGAGNFVALSEVHALPQGLYLVVVKRSGATVGLTKVIKAE